MPSREQTWRFGGEGNRELRQIFKDLGVTSEDALNRMEKATTDLNKQLDTLSRRGEKTKSTFSLVNAQAKSLTTALLGAAGLTAGIAGLASATASAIGQMQSFETELKSVETLLGQGGTSIETYRQRLISLDANLGSTTQLTQGLYQTISAGVQGDPIAFLRESAELAIGGVASTTAAVDLLATSLNSYGKTAADAQEASDILFTTVKLGRTTIPELAQTLARAIPNAAGLGINLRDLNAAIATLTAGGAPTDQAITGINSFIRSLVQQNEVLKKLGIDFRQVIGQEGLLGIIKDLRDATAGDPILIRKLVPDSEGATAVLTLVNEQFESFSSKIKALRGDLSGAQDTAFQTQISSSAAAMLEFNNELDRFIQTAQPLVLPTLTSITKGFTDFIKGLRPRTGEALTSIEGLKQSIEDVNKQIEKGPTLLQRYDAAVLGLGTGSFFPETNEQLESRLAALQRLLKIEESIQAGRNLNRQLQQQEDAKARARFEERRKQEQEAATARIKAAEAEEKARKKAVKDAEKLRKEAIQVVLDDLKAETDAYKESQLVQLNEARKRYKEEERLRKEAQEQDKRLREQAVQVVLDDLRRQTDAYKETQVAQLNAARSRYQKEQDLARQAAERQRQDIEDLTSVFADAFFGIGQDRQRDFVESFRQMAAEIVRQQVFRPLFQQISDGIQEAFSSAFRQGAQDASSQVQVRGPGGQTTPPLGQGIGTGFNFSALGGLALNIGGGIAAADFFNALSGGGNFRGSAIGGIFSGLGAGGTGSNILGGVGTGAASGALVGSIVPGIGTAIGAGVGAAIGGLVSGLSQVFGGGGSTEATLLTSQRLLQSQLSDRARVRSPFGQLGLSREGTGSIDAFGVIQRVADVDTAIAELLTDRQEAAVTALLQSQGPFDARAAVGAQEDVVAQLIQQRFNTILDALGGQGTARAAFGDYQASAENIQGITQTFTDLLDVLQTLDSIRNPAQPIHEAQLAIDAINDRFDDLVDSAHAFNRSQADIQTLQLGRVRALRLERENFEGEIENLILAITDPYKLALRELEQAQQNQLANARILGADISRVQVLHREERLALERQYNQEEIKIIEDRFSTVRSLLNGLQQRTQFQSDLASLTANFERLAQAAKDAELPLHSIRSAFVAAAQDLRFDINRNIERTILGFTNPFEKAIQELIDVQIEQFQNVQSAGGSLSRLLVAQRLEQQKLFEQFNQTTSGSTGQIASFIQDLQTGESGGLGILQRERNARVAFTRALAERDESAAVSLGGQLLDIARERFASGERFAQERNSIINQLDELRRSLESTAPSESQFEQFLRRFEVVQTSPTLDRLGSLQDAIESQDQGQTILLRESNRIQGQINTSVINMTASVNRSNAQTIAAIQRLIVQVQKSDANTARAITDAFTRLNPTISF